MNKMKRKYDLILKFFQGAKTTFVISIFASLAMTIFNALTPQVFRFGIDSVLGGKGGYGFLKDHLWMLAGVLILLAVCSGCAQFIFRYSTAAAGEQFAKNMRDTLFSHIQKLPMIWQDENQTGDIIQRCTSDVETIRTFVAKQLLEVFRTVFLIVVSFAMIFMMNPKLSLIVLIFVPLIVCYSLIFYNLIGSQFILADEAEGELSTTVQENATGVRVIRAFGREKYEMDRFKEKNDAFAGLWIKLGKLMGAYWAVGDIFTGMQVVVVVVLGAIEAVNGRISVGEFIAFASYNSTLIWPIRALGRILSEMSKADVSFERIEYIVHSIEEDDPVKEEISLPSYDIAFDQVNFAYKKEHPILKDISLKIPQGSTIGILGGTGSGKSTLVQLLMRLYETEDGQISIGGIDIKKMPLSQLRKCIGMVLQEPFLYSKTIYENICANCPEASLEEVRAVAKIACIDQAIMEFPDGYNTIVGERGITLSGGQRQRVAIARMLMEKCPIMIFDDSLSAVDSETDYLIRNALKEHMKNSTVILISHRITSLMSTDYIYVMKDGEIAEEGSHRQLVENSGIYHEIYDIQMNLDDRLELDQGKKGGDKEC